jgi:hypothetical protein
MQYYIMIEIKICIMYSPTIFIVILRTVNVFVMLFNKHLPAL